MNKDIAVKSKVLDMLKQFMFSESGKKFAPKTMSVEVISTKPLKDKEGLKEVLEEASEKRDEEEPMDKFADKVNAEKAGVSEEDWEDSEGDEEADEKNKKMSLREFLRNC